MDRMDQDLFFGTVLKRIGVPIGLCCVAGIGYGIYLLVMNYLVPLLKELSKLFASL